ncbi:MFS transporter [Paenibacillus pasadenensis]|uniref:MFS transporter n=1 Tax=Paenibacillus pasadenensis TaxID=217090 RepID=UPI0020415ACB|nr:MFS transporter [Paenibacillus pasadenensis]MCM3748891.1 MFS transporter [Paenibacillus pasadenensis]
MLSIILIMSLVATAVSPLFPLYGNQYGLNSLELSLLFTSYAVVLLPVLLVTSARGAFWGLKKVTRIAIWLAIVASVLFLANASVWMLYGARMLEGAAYGLFTGVAVPYLLRITPESRSAKAILLSGITVSFGFGLGPAISGMLAEYISVIPARLPYLIFIVMLLICAALIEMLPHEKRNGDEVPGKISIGVPPGISRHFWMMAALPIFTLFTINGIVFALIPTFVVSVLENTNLSISGLLSLLLLGGGALLQLLPVPSHPVVRLRAGLAFLAVGAWTVVLSGQESSLLLLWIGVALQALGTGWGLQVSLRFAGELPEAKDRPRVITTYYFVAYLGFIVPIGGLGVLSNMFGMNKAMFVMDTAGMLLILCTIAYSLRFKREYYALKDIAV